MFFPFGQFSQRNNSKNRSYCNNLDIYRNRRDINSSNTSQKTLKYILFPALYKIQIIVERKYVSLENTTYKTYTTSPHPHINKIKKHVNK